MFNRKNTQKKLSRKEKKEIKKRQKNRKKKMVAFEGEEGFVGKAGFVEYDGYVKSEETGDYITVYDVLVKYGTHNPESLGWYTQFIPSVQITNGDIWFGHREKGMGKSTENTIFSTTINSRQKTQFNMKAPKDIREQSKRDLERADIALVHELSKADEHIIDSDIVLVVRAKSPEKLELAIKELRQNYKDNGISGFMFLRKTSRILESLHNIFVSISADEHHNSDVQTVAATRLFFPSSGFLDEEGGVFVGTDVHSFVLKNPSIINFAGIRHAVIRTGGVKGDVSIGGLEGARMVSNYGSALAHVIAEDNYLTAGTRTHFINLVNFNYHFPDSKVFDMSKYTINSLEVYGSKDTVTQAANANFDKVIEIMLLLIDQKETDLNIKATLNSLLVDWMTHRANGNGMYTEDTLTEPTLAWRILATDRHENYPTLSDFIPELQMLVARRSKDGERATEKANLIYESISTANRRYPQIFKEKTNIPDTFLSTDRNIYYDLSTINTKNVRSATFLNVLAYVVNRARSGDMVVITGLDNIKVDPSILKTYRDVLDDKNIGLITTFEDRENQDVNIDTMSPFTNTLVTQDLVVLGGVISSTLPKINESFGKELPDIVSDDLKENVPSRFYIYRKRDFGNAVIDTHLIL